MTDEVFARVMLKVAFTNNDCWTWQGATSRGYAQMRVSGKTEQVHRLVYEREHGPIPDGIFLDHLCHGADPTCQDGRTCRHRRCINPDHLEAVTHKTNMERGINARKAECPKGHPYSGANLYIDKTGRRHCRECRRARTRQWYRESDGVNYHRAWRERRDASRAI